MTKEQIIIRDHKLKSDKLKKAKREIKKLRKGSINVSVLERKLQHEKVNEVNSLTYMGFDGFDDEGFVRAEARQKARIELLENLIREAKA